MSETGRIDYSPDYKSPAYVCPECGGPHSLSEHGNVEAQRARLRDAVVEAAKAWNSTNHRDKERCEERLTYLGDAVDALVQFESKEK